MAKGRTLAQMALERWGVNPHKPEPLPGAGQPWPRPLLDEPGSWTLSGLALKLHGVDTKQARKPNPPDMAGPKPIKRRGPVKRGETISDMAKREERKLYTVDGRLRDVPLDGRAIAAMRVKAPENPIDIGRMRWDRIHEFITYNYRFHDVRKRDAAVIAIVVALKIRLSEVLSMDTASAWDLVERPGLDVFYRKLVRCWLLKHRRLGLDPNIAFPTITGRRKGKKKLSPETFRWLLLKRSRRLGWAPISERDLLHAVPDRPVSGNTRIDGGEPSRTH